MKLKRFENFLNENLSELTNKLSDENRDLKEYLLEMIKKSINLKDTDDTSLLEEKIDSIIKDPEGSTIEGLIQDSDVMDFYRKYRNDIDKILNDDGFFEKIGEFQKESNCISLYDFTIKGTIECVKIIVLQLKNDLFGETASQNVE